MKPRLILALGLDIMMACVWLAGALSLVIAESSTRLADELGGFMGSNAVAFGLPVVVGAETYLGLRLLLRDHVEQARRLSLALLALLTSMLLFRGVTQGWSIRCLCLDAVLHQSTAGGVVRNMFLVLSLLMASRLGRVRPKAPLASSDE